MTPRRPQTTRLSDPNPGPGSYNHKVASHTKAPSYGQGTSQRSSLVKSLSPGPGTYSSPTAKNPGVQFTKDLKQPMPKIETQPGPGQYTLPHRGIEGPNYSLRSRQHIKQIVANPGPGAYNTVNTDTYANKNPSFGLGTEVRNRPNKQASNPGPGQYDTRGKIEGKQYGFGTDKGREKEIKKEHPGFVYNPPSTIANIPKYLA